MFPRFLKVLNEQAIFHVEVPERKKHRVTQTEKKSNVITNEIEFFSLQGAIGGDVYLGVVGNGSGLEAHIQQAKRLGYNDLRNVFFFEMVKNYFYDILQHYLKRLDIHELIFKASDLINSQAVHAPIETFVKNNLYRLRGVFSIRGDHPNILCGVLPINGNEFIEMQKGFNFFESKRVIKDKNKKKTVQNFISPERVTHIDFDVTGDPKSEKESINNIQGAFNNTVTFFETYPNLKSLVQVYSWKRGQLSNAKMDTDWNNFESEWGDVLDYIESNNITKDTERRIGAIKGLVRKDGGDLTMGAQNADSLRELLENNGYPSFLQLYIGAGGTNMLSIATVRNGEPYTELEVEPSIGVSDEKCVKYLIKDIIKYIQDNPQNPARPRLEKIIPVLELYINQT